MSAYKFILNQYYFLIFFKIIKIFPIIQLLKRISQSCNFSRDQKKWNNHKINSASVFTFLVRREQHYPTAQRRLASRVVRQPMAGQASCTLWKLTRVSRDRQSLRDRLVRTHAHTHTHIQWYTDAVTSI